MDYYKSDIQDIFRSLQSRMEGISVEDANSRLDEHGKNVIYSAKSRSTLKILFAQFTSPLILVLIVATFASTLLGEWIDAAVVGIAILVNGVLGFVEEYRADHALRALESYMPVLARVRRGGKVLDVKSEEIVVGDILLLRAGDRVVADARIFRATDLSTDESPLTGESTSVSKNAGLFTKDVEIGDRSNMVFAGTVVAGGMGEAVVVRTAKETEIGKISSLVGEVGYSQTPLQKQIASLAQVLSGIILLATLGLVVIGLLRGYAFGELVTTGIAIAVSAVPEGLAIVTTAILAIGMQRLLKQQVLVRRLVATETLGSVSVICVDKTGTLTTGEMAVRDVYLPPDHHFDIQTVQSALQMNLSYAHESASATSPTERAIVHYLDQEASVSPHRMSFTPFNSSDKYSAADFEFSGSHYRALLGAPDVLVDYSDHISDAEREWANSVMEREARSGRRLVALLMGELENDDWHKVSLAGFVIIEDPLREGAVEGVHQAQEAGLRPVMITGDHPETAFSIASELGMAHEFAEVVTGKHLDEMGDTQLAQRIHDISVFARVRPDHKLRIVRMLQEEGEVIAMMGDGVNDAPALKAADIGVSVGSATEVAKGASDMVLLERAFSVVTGAIFEGRIIFENIRKVAIFLMITSFSGLSIIAGSLLLGLPIPFSPIQLLWINLVTDGLPGFALGFEPGEDGILHEGPRRKHERLLGLPWFSLLFFSGFFNAALVLGAYVYNLQTLELSVDAAKSTAFITLGSIALFFIFSARVLRSSIYRSNPLNSPVVIASAVFSILLLLFPFALPFTRSLFEVSYFDEVPWWQVTFIVLLSLVVLDFAKVQIMRRIKSRV